MHTRTVVAIPASYNHDETLDLKSTKLYVKYLESHGASCTMTTAGTSHFNLLSIEEIHQLNESVVESFNGQKIIGIPALSTNLAKTFIERANEYIDDNTSLMALYPDRFYGSGEDIVSHMSQLRSHTKDKIYVHGKTIRNATGGTWDYNSGVINTLFRNGTLRGIKEEHSSLSKSYDFVSELHPDIDVIVAGGSMRRFEFLRSAGANSFLSGVGNLFPEIEQDYINGDTERSLYIEKKIFNVFMTYGWHKSLRIALDHLGLTCHYDRQPWPKAYQAERQQIANIIEEIIGVK